MQKTVFPKFRFLGVRNFVFIAEDIMHNKRYKKLLKFLKVIKADKIHYNEIKIHH